MSSISPQEAMSSIPPGSNVLYPQGVVAASDIDLQWPTHLALSPLDNSLHFLDDHVLMQVSLDGRIVVRAGTPMHCPTSTLPHTGK